MLTNLTASTEETQEAFETLVGAIKGLDLWHIATIVLLLLACMVVMKVLLRLLDRTFRRLEVEKSLHTFVRAALRVFLWIITICLVLGYIGIPMTSLIAVLSVLGLAITLAVQGSLSNLAGGIQVLVSKPFKADDYIEVGSVGGTVAEVGLVYTKLRTIDNKIISIPNGQISGEKIVNYSTEEKRRVDLTFNTSYDDAPERVTACIRDVIGAHPKAFFTPEPFVRVSAYQASSVEYTVRVWCATEDYWALYFDLLEQVKAAFDRAGIEMTYNHLNVHMVDHRK
ncbi:mechanosensitive ion channel family protein [Flavonifractor sp. DFI.6.63]|uniref:mechanosensitive ion channel family protein n=1 Tax=Oscillospiraceae TaxID=216572 RepID=UPI00210B6408|nr:mechanosensitive ion channel family protein [Lawsonibacter sp.]MCI6397788.1 mechanosensitive ion channel family protein [Lawsonibacter sp.]MCQ5030636.1 mechanosensitive ion channel family protein [Flavonifractor sp. DFI.6.63]MDY2977630.1 mechanosensitive ion channel family protein [Oscillospiraceae bacterium]